jgi:hypothetical protein
MSIVVEIDAHRPKSRSRSTPKTKAAAAKSALAGPTVLIPADEIPAYRTLVQSLIDQYQPASREEHVLVQSLADIEWRLRRIPSLEAGIYASGRKALADAHSECQDPAIRAALIDAETYMKHQREFCGLSLQETRLLRLRRRTLTRLSTK